MKHQTLVEDHIRKEISELMEVCTECNGNGWFTGSEAGHGCDGSEESCQMNCPIEVPIQVGCDYCSGEGMVETHPITIAHYLRVLPEEYCITKDGSVYHFSDFEYGSPSEITFNLTTQAPQSEEDWKKLAELFELV